MSATLEQAVAAGTPQQFDGARAGAFAGRLMNDMAGAMTALVCAVGDRLGLFKVLATSGPVTPAELAACAGVDERLTREWLQALSAAGYLEYDSGGGRYVLPPEHAPALAWEGNPAFMGGGLQQVPALAAQADRVAAAFRSGGGVPQDAYGEGLREGMERMSASWFENLLVQHWLPAVPAARAQMERGARVADVGCGAGRALIRLARAFPGSSFTGFDLFAPAVERARASAASAGVADRVRFEERDATQGLPGEWDLVLAFDSLHDFPDPARGLAAIRRALAPGGRLLALEMSCSERPEENTGPLAAILYATSVLYNTPVALAHGGAAPGTMGLPESRIRTLCADAGFGMVRRVFTGDPVNALYEVEP